jgi:hypothetical protein
MTHEINDIESSYQQNLARLEEHVQTTTLKIKQWRISTYKRNWYFRSLKNWKQKQLSYLAIIRDKKIEAIPKFVLPNDSISNISPSMSEPRKKACLIGFHQTDSDGPNHDIYRLKDILEKNYQYSENDVSILINSQSTRADILDSFTELVKNGEDGDSLFFSFSENGLYIENTDEWDAGKEIHDIIQTHLKKDVRMFLFFDNNTTLNLRYEYMRNNNPSSIIHLNHAETTNTILCIKSDNNSQNENGSLMEFFVESLSNSSSWEDLIQKMRELIESNGLTRKPQFSSGTPIDIHGPIHF